MKKYKLIKEYDGSPKLGTIIVETMIIGNNPKFRTFTISGHDKNCDMGKFRLDNPEISPEFWEEVVEYPIGTKAKDNRINKTFTKEVDGWYTSSRTGHTDKSISNAKHIKVLEEVIEKDYEILSLKCLEDNEIFYNRNETYKFLFNQLEYNLKNGYIIHSVKRLSDGEAFTVGDIITYGKNTHGERLKIEEFKINNNKLFIKFDSDPMYFNDFGCKNFQHYKKPLFTTEDGVDIFEGDNVHWVCDEFTYFFTRNVDKTRCNLITSGKHGLFKIFSTKEAAENFIILNKPCLSINDILKFCGSTQCDNIKTVSLEGLKTTVKSKL